jgi:pyruvate dehydrogenase E2 component (dihydrolipoamide acetyltransferase)
MEEKRLVRGIPVAQVIPLRGIHKKMAEHMIQSHLTTAGVTTFKEMDVTEFVRLKERLSATPDPAGPIKISYTHMMIKAIAHALREHLVLNSTLIGDEVLVFEDINIGMAVAMPDGNLIVPVIHQADKKSILEITRRALDLQERAKNRKLDVADVQKGTFTLTNVGVVPEARWGTPLLNQGQCAILETGAIRQIPAVREGQVVIRWVSTISLTYDHRIVNGVPVAYFTHTLAQTLNDPGKLDWGIDIR